MSEPEAQKDGPVGQTVGASSPLAKSPTSPVEEARKAALAAARALDAAHETAAAAPGPDLAQALRRARAEADPSGKVADLAAPEQKALELLQTRLAPVYAQIPKDCDLFDARLLPGARPRLSIDRIAFVEMAPDGRQFSFLQDMHLDRVVLAETGDVDKMAGTVTDYIARRIVERERALAMIPATTPAVESKPAISAPTRPVTRAVLNASKDKGGFVLVLARLFLFILEVLGSMTFFGLLAAAGWLLYQAATGYTVLP